MRAERGTDRLRALRGHRKEGSLPDGVFREDLWRDGIELNEEKQPLHWWILILLLALESKLFLKSDKLIDTGS